MAITELPHRYQLLDGSQLPVLILFFWPFPLEFPHWKPSKDIGDLITIMHIFYNQHGMLPLHRQAWQQHPSQSVQYVLVDDGSPTPIPDDFRRDELKVYRIHEDIPWNIAGARNLGFHVATTDWVLSADIDHVVTHEALKDIMQLDLSDPNTVYTFNRRREDGFVGCDAIINILMNQRRFFEIGGYDEDYSGHYGKEETFFLHCLKHHRVRIVKCEHIVLEWHPILGRTWKLSRDLTFNKKLFECKMTALHERRYHPGQRLRFSWSLRS